MLELRKGKSTKSYENDFFRILAGDLSRVFDARGWDGLLIGMPEFLGSESLQIDCLLVTDDWIVLIDFKNYGGDLELPELDMFDSGVWKIDGVPVRGGSSVNPYRQLGRQRAKLSKQLGWAIHGFDRSSVCTLTCFHGQINMIGSVPRHILGFDIVDARSVLNKIVDIVDVQVENRNYLKPVNRELFTDKLFVAPMYQISITADAALVAETKDEVESAINTINIATRPEAAGFDLEELYGTSISEFLLSNDRILILSGNTKSGKTGFIPTIRDIAFDNEFVEVPVFAYSNRLKKRMLDSHPNIQEVDSLYGTVFDFRNEAVDENYKKNIPVKSVNSVDERNTQGKILYIIDDSQLITNSRSDSETLQFGTGCLLDDVLTFMQLDRYPERKIIFIGDTNRISYGSNVENAMNTAYLAALLERKGVKSEVRSLVLPSKSSDSEIVNICNKLAVSIENDSFNSLIISSTGNVHIGDFENQKLLLEAAYESPMHNKILVYTNMKANQINYWIKNKLAKNGTEIGSGDVVVFNSTTSAFAPDHIVNEDAPFNTNEQPFNFDEPKRVDNGNFATVISVDQKSTLEISRDINGESVRLVFIPCQVKLQDSSLLQIYVFDNYLKANKAELERTESIAYKVILQSLLNDYLSAYKFEDSKEYTAMKAKGNTYYQITKGGYRLFEDARKLTLEEMAFRKRLEYRLRNDQFSDYFKVYHAAHVKYAWAMTVNKAMSFTFDSIFFNTHQGEGHGRTNKDYFKWLYTGFATANNRVELINWIPISPFMRTVFNLTPSSTAPKVKQFIFCFSNDDETKEAEFADYLTNSLLHSGWQLSDISPRNYMEIVKLQKGETTLELFFDYKGKGEMKLPRLKSGDAKSFNEVTNILKNAIKSDSTITSASFNQCTEIGRAHV